MARKAHTKHPLQILREFEKKVQEWSDELEHRGTHNGEPTSQHEHDMRVIKEQGSMHDDLLDALASMQTEHDYLIVGEGVFDWGLRRQHALIQHASRYAQKTAPNPLVELRHYKLLHGEWDIDGMGCISWGDDSPGRMDDNIQEMRDALAEALVQAIDGAAGLTKMLLHTSLGTDAKYEEKRRKLNGLLIEAVELASDIEMEGC